MLVRPVLSLLLLAAQAQAPKSFDAPRLRIEPGGKLDLGSLGPRQVALQPYLFTNTSDAPITLRVYELSPGVTVAGAALRGAIPAHGAAELLLRLDPSGWVGPQARNVKLGTDDPHQGNYYLPVEAMVRPDLTVDGTRRDFGDLAAPGSFQEVFTFTRETGEPTVLRVTQAPPPYLELEVQQEKAVAKLLCTLRTAQVPPGVRLGFEEIAVETNAPLQDHFDLYLGWKLHHPIDAVPSRLVFLDRETALLELKVESQAGKPFRILKAEVEGEGFRVDPFPEAAAASHPLKIHRTAQVRARAMLVLGFDSGDEPLRVPLAFLP